MKIVKRRILAGLLCMALFVTDIMSSGILVSANQETDLTDPFDGNDVEEKEEDEFEKEDESEEGNSQAENPTEDDSDNVNEDESKDAAGGDDEGEIDGSVVAEESVDADMAFDGSAEERLALMVSEDDIASGFVDKDYGHIAWVIDVNGNLVVDGSGDYCKPDSIYAMEAPWLTYKSSIKSAEIKVNGMTDSSLMFYGCSNLTSVDLRGLETSTITYMNGMFESCKNLISLDLSSFDTSNVTNMWGMFYKCRNLTSVDLSSFNTSNVTNMQEMFYGCNSLTSLDLSSFDTSNVTSMNSMFCSCIKLESLDVSSFNTGSVTDMKGMFSGCDSLTSLDVSSFDTSKVTDMSWMFSSNILDTDISWMFSYRNSLTSLDLSSFDTSNVTSMRWMFYCCTSLKSLNVSSFDTKNVNDMREMFEGCESLMSLDVSSFDTRNVTYMGGMFDDCAALKSLDLRSFNTSNVTGMRNMFYYCTSLESVDVSSFDTRNVTDMYGMFGICEKLENLDLRNFSTGNVSVMSSMFEGCSNLISLNLSSFDTSNVIIMKQMFANCNSLADVDVSSFNTENVTNMDNMFYGCGSLAELDLSSFNVSGLDSFSGVLSDNLTTIYTPYNLSVSVELPVEDGDVWYRSDGTAVTQLPQNLAHSIALGRNHIPEEKEDSIGKLINSGTSIFLFRNKMTGAAIKEGSVSIGEDYKERREYYPSEKNGYIEVTLSRNCNQVFIKHHFEQYEISGGMAVLDDYREDSGIYVFYVSPKPDSYIPKLPSVNTAVDTLGPTVETDEGSIDLFNMNMEFAMDFGKGIKSKVAYDEISKTIQVALSSDEKKLDYDVIKDEFKTPESKTLDQQLKALENAEIMNAGTVSSVDVKLAVEGYVEFGENSEFIEGGVTVKLKGSGSTEYRPVCTAGLAYAKYEMGISAQGKIKLKYVDGNVSYAAALKLEPYGVIAVGAGWSLAHVEIGATGKMQLSFTFPYINNRESISVDAVFGLYGEVKFFCIGTTRTTEIKGNIWPGVSSDNYTALSDISYDIALDDELSILPRDYLASNSGNRIYSYNAQTDSNLTSSDSFRYSDISGDKGVFEENNVQYVKLIDGTEILAWIHDFGDKSSANRTTLVYSVNKNDGNGWSGITPVCTDTSTGDYYPNMTAEGETAYLVWSKASKVFGENVDVNEICQNMDVYASVFEDGVFSKPQMVSDADNGLVEFSPIVAADENKAAVAWMINSENDYHYTKGNNSIYICEYNGGAWSKPICYASDLNYVSDYDMDYVDGSVALLYAEDADNISATQDGCVYYIQGNNKTMVGDASYNAEIVDFCDGMLYFSGGNRVYKAAANNLSYIYDTGIETSNFSIVKSASGAEAVMFLKQDGYMSNVYASYHRNGIYTTPVPIVSDCSRVTNYSSVYNDDGTISIAYDEDEVLEAADYIYGLTDMVIKKNVKPNLFYVDSDLAYNASEVAPGNIIEFAAAASNYTVADVSKVKVSLKGSIAGEVYEGILDVDIPVGEMRYISLPYTLPDNIVNQYYTLTVTPVDFEDSDLSDNSAVCELGFSDIKVDNLQINDNVISGKITNVGYKTAENVSLALREDNQENDPIAELSYEGRNLAVGESWEFSYEVEPIDFQDVDDIKYYLILTETDSQQNSYINDSGIIYSTPKVPEEISFEYNTLTLTEKTASVVKATVLPEDTAFNTVIYASSDNSVAVVDSEGNVYAVGEGSAIITAYTMDLSLWAECGITVEGLEEETYKLSERGLELDMGDETSLYVIDENGDEAESVLWSSTDENIVSITQDGTVLAKGEGIAYLTAHIDNFIDVCIVRVSNRSIVQLACEEALIYLTVGETTLLNITVIPENTTMNKTLTYISENESVAAVSASGLVTAVTEGSTSITVSSVNGIQKEIYIYVNAPVVYTVAFDTMGGTRVDSVEVTPDKTKSEDGNEYIGYLSSIPETHKEGYSFIGWYTDKNGTGEALSINTPITGDVIYYAKWQSSGFGGNIEDDTEGVLPGDIPEDGIPEGLWIAGIKDYVYTGKAIKPSLRVYYNDVRLKETQDYTIKYKNNTKAAEASSSKAPTVTIKGKGNFSGTANTKFTIRQAQLTEENLFAASVYPSGTKYTPVVMFNGNILKVKTDYTLTYFQYIGDTENNTDMQKLSKQPTKEGNYCMQIIGKGSCSGEIIFNYTIASDKNSGAVSIAKGKAVIGEMIYGGSIPDAALNLNGEPLMPDIDYKVIFSNTDTKGTATATFIGIGNYCGTLKKTFKVKAAPLPEGCIIVTNSVSYEKGGAQPKVSVVVNNITLIKGKDYTVSYKNNKKLGDSAVVTVKGKGNYSGSCKASFNITAKDLSSEDVLVYVSDAAIGKKPAVTVYDSNGKKLASGSDYKALVDMTGHMVELSAGKNNLYTGTKSITYQELDAGKIISSVKLGKNYKKFLYTGEEIKLEKDWLTVKAGKVTLSSSEFEIIDYINNIEKGTATVIVKGIDGYGGTKQVNFTIKSQSMPSIIEWFASLIG